MKDVAGVGGGNIAEGEDIRLIRLPAADVISMAHNGDIKDAKTLIAFQWLELALARSEFPSLSSRHTRPRLEG